MSKIKNIRVGVGNLLFSSVDIMRKKLDSENLGIILLNAFMDEFFPKEESSTPDMFSLYHYNGLPHSNVNGQVMKYLCSRANLAVKFGLTFIAYNMKARHNLK